MGSFTPPPTLALSPGDQLDRYELLCVLAQGGMGTVWLARLTGKLGFERLVALKTILPTYSNDKQFGEMFLFEARIAAQIDHENVARILEIGEDRGSLYYAMELIDGESLRRLYHDAEDVHAAIPMGVALRIAADTCAGLHATHELRAADGTPLEVVHRDVSPQNLLISVRGTTKLIDFGVAKAQARRTEATAAGTLKGKIEYMAPEQARGEPIDRRADVYSVGAMLYELLAGRPMRCTDGRQLAALHELVTGAPYPPLPRSIPDIVRAVVDGAVAPNPKDRFRTADELRLAIERAMIATAETATTDDVAAVLSRFCHERIEKRRRAIEESVRAASEGRLEDATVINPPKQVTTAPIPFLPLPAPSARDGPSTGPSMRTIHGSSMSARPTPEASGSRVLLSAVVLGLVALLGLMGGVVLTRHEKGFVREPEAMPTPVPVPLPLPTVIVEPAPSLAANAAAPEARSETTSEATPEAKVEAKPETKAEAAEGSKSEGKGTVTAAKPHSSSAHPRSSPRRSKPSDVDEYGF